MCILFGAIPEQVNSHLSLSWCLPCGANFCHWGTNLSSLYTQTFTLPSKGRTSKLCFKEVTLTTPTLSMLMSIGPNSIPSSGSTNDANTVKWTTLVPWIGLSENVTKLYINFEFCEGENHKHLKNTLIYKAK